MEGIGAHPERAVVFPHGLEEQSFDEEALESADHAAAMLVLPPFGVFKVAAAVFDLFRVFMRHGIQFPAQMLRFLEIADDSHQSHGHEGYNCHIGQTVEKMLMVVSCRVVRQLAS